MAKMQFFLTMTFTLDSPFQKLKFYQSEYVFFFFKGPRESIHSPSRHNLTASSFSYLHDFVSQNKPLRENT